MSSRIEPAEAMRLIAQPGVVTRVVETGVGPSGWGSTFFDGDVLIEFDLPDGSTLHYIAVQESDYYGGHYDKIQWELTPADAPDKPSGAPDADQSATT